MQTFTEMKQWAIDLNSSEAGKDNNYCLPEEDKDWTSPDEMAIAQWEVVRNLPIEDECYYESYTSLYAWLNENAS